ncbi:Heparinase II/III-like protein [Tenacibaculum sp. 190524A02b]|uniref:Heparinase II/III-like protein n=1 Tax=Tenacibaculum vairaonense TaxID=3137860 RepID=A0ABP1FBE6_9FLAO
MIQKLKRIINLISNMGMRYVFFRVSYIVKSKIGWHKKVFPINPDSKEFITLEQWKENLPPFFFYGKKIKGLEVSKIQKLVDAVKSIKEGEYLFFNKEKINLGKNYNWITNPSTGFVYDAKKHWSEIQDISSEAGDIKYVWEKARFSFLYDLIRYDFHSKEDQSELVLAEIESFIDKNPVNQGPNYKCSQEISLRVLNWTFALYYYKDSNFLTSHLFAKIMNSIYWQVHHVYGNIHFSRISVRNNHAITETLMLYLSGKLFPFLPNVKKWSAKGKKWFEQEIEYQIYPDGTFLQFSMNYHRVTTQLLTWGIQLANLNEEKFKPVVYERAKKSLEFLTASSDPVTGQLPNYGSNDGALFFKLTDDDYRVYKSQLDDLRAVLYGKTFYNSQSVFWYGVQPENVAEEKRDEISIFENSGYYIIQEDDIKTFIRCGAYKDRPAQSDNLHLDIWVNGENLIRDSGSYKYNTDKEYLNYFNGCEGHNTLSIAGKDQMLKGGRFIWYYWVKKASAKLIKQHKSFNFEGQINAFKQLNKNIIHKRSISKELKSKEWLIKDSVTNSSRKIYQYWHLPLNKKDQIEITSTDALGNNLTPIIEEKWFSGYYGVKEASLRITFETNTNQFNTKIKVL